MNQQAHPGSGNARHDQTPLPVEDEPNCLIGPDSALYRPGVGFTCRQIMMPLILVALLLVATVVIQFAGFLQSPDPGLMQWFGVLLPLVMLALIIRAMLFVRKSLLEPLTQIRHWVSAVRGGHYSARMPPLSQGEFNALANDINRLADQVQTLNEDLEGEVKAQTEILATKTQSLTLLYEVVTMVNEADDGDALLGHFMRRLAEVYQADAMVARILRDDRLDLLDSYGIGEQSKYMAPSVPVRAVLQSKTFGEGQISVMSELVRESLPGDKHDRAEHRVISIPLCHRDAIHGSFQMFVPAAFNLVDDSRELLASVGQHLGVFLEQSRLDTETGKLMLVEERARLANELHDSLAQTLASLRFQTRVLDETLHQGDEQVTWEELEKLEEQVEIANTELRSLMGQFRAPLQSEAIMVSINNLVQKFRKETGVAVFLQNQWADDDLSADDRTDIIRIVQEGLANIRKHAEASSVRVLMRNDASGYRVVVEDDGRGYDEELIDSEDSGHAGEHIGRDIMRERAERLGADLQLESEPGDGSAVILEYRYRESAVDSLAATA